ncbi:MAG: hypothetical protein QOI36_2547 [Pseudonocardiales bacterium]|nr:hypothetical protein [Pseudonocardiales bacterium]
MLLPDVLGTYSDAGNALILAQRARWRRVRTRVLDITATSVPPASCDIYLLGGGEAGAQAFAAEWLARYPALRHAMSTTAVTLLPLGWVTRGSGTARQTDPATAVAAPAPGGSSAPTCTARCSPATPPSPTTASSRQPGLVDAGAVGLDLQAPIPLAITVPGPHDGGTRTLDDPRWPHRQYALAFPSTPGRPAPQPNPDLGDNPR